MKFALKELLNSTRGKYVFSILLGIGLASLFRKACSNRNCLVFQAPSLDKINNKIFNFNNKCYKFENKSASCINDNDNIKQVHVDDTIV